MKEKTRKYVFRCELSGGNYRPVITESSSRIAAWGWVLRQIQAKQKLRDLKSVQLISEEEVTPPWDE